MEIKINITNLDEAGRAFNRIEGKLKKSNFMLGGMNLIEESSGLTCSAVNEAYRDLKCVETSLAILVEKTRRAMESIGVKFQETDKALAEEMGENLNMPNGMIIPFNNKGR